MLKLTLSLKMMRGKWRLGTHPTNVKYNSLISTHTMNLQQPVLHHLRDVISPRLDRLKCDRKQKASGYDVTTQYATWHMRLSVPLSQSS